MRTTHRSRGLTVTLAATLLLTGCGKQSADVGAPAPAAPAGTTDPAPTTEPPTDPPTDSAAPTTTVEPGKTDDDVLAIADEPAWTAAGRLVGSYGDVAVVHDGEPGSTDGRLTARTADGSVAWERALSVPDHLAGATDVSVVVLRGHRTLRLAWSGTGDGGTTLAVGTVVDPATGEDVAAGTVEIPAGYVVSEPVSGDQVWLEHPNDLGQVVTIAEDGSITVDVGGGRPAESLAVTHDLLVDGVDSVVRVSGPDGPLGEATDCAPVAPVAPDGPGVGPGPALSPDRDLLWLGMAVVDLTDGTATCLAAPPEVPGGFTAVADDGTLAGALLADPLSGEDCEWCELTGIALWRDGEVVTGGPAEARPEGFLHDVLLVATEAGVAAYPLG